MLKNIFSISFWTLISRVLGVFRDIALANYLGVGALSDAFFLAWRLPNTLRKLFAEGSMQTIFIPELTSAVMTKDEQYVQRLINYIWTILLLVIIVIVLLSELIMPSIIHIIAPGIDSTGAHFDKVVKMARITFPYIFFITMVSFISSVLNVFKKFKAPAITPIIFNLVIILAFLFNAKVLLRFDMAYSNYIIASVSVLIAGMIQTLWLWYALQDLSIKIAFQKPKLIPEVRNIFKNYIPVLFSSGCYQVNVLIDTIFATLVGIGSVSSIYYADRLYQFPIGVLGVAMSIVLLTELSRRVKAKQNVIQLQNRAIELAFLITMPLVILVCFCANEVVETIFQRGSFNSEHTIDTANYLRVIALTLAITVSLKVIQPIYYAHSDIKTTVKISIVTVLISICLLWYFVNNGYGLMGIAYATVITNSLNL